MQVEPLDETIEAVAGVDVATLANSESMSIQYFRLEPGAEVPSHRHPHEQVGYIITGTLTFVLDDGEEMVVGADDSYALASEEPHAAVNRGEEPVVGLDIFSPPRIDPDWAE